MITGLLALIIHFSLIVIHATPFVSPDHKLHYVAKGYAGSFFHQSWNLFVPPPDNNYNLFVTFENNGKHTEDVFNELVTAHQQNRLAGHGLLVVGLSNVVYMFEKSTALQAPVNGPIKKDIYFTMVEQAAKNYIQNKYKISIKTIKLILLAKSCDTKKQRIYFN